MKVEGGCYCGGVRYQAEGDALFKGQCFCRECQYVSGGSPNVVMGMPQSGFDYTSGAAQSDAFSSETRIIQFYSEANAYYRVGANPTAAIGDPIALLIGGGGKHTTIAVEPGQKISFLAV